MFVNVIILSPAVSIVVSLPPAPVLVAVAALGAAGQPVEGGVLRGLVDGAAGVDAPGVAQHHVEGGVAQEEPQDIHVAAVFQVAGGEVVAEAVGAAAAGHPGAVLQAPDHGPHAVEGHRLPFIGQPQRLPPLWSEFQVAPQRFPGLPVDGHHPHLAPLAQHLELLQPGVEVAQADIAELFQPEAGGDEYGDDGLVADAEVAVAEPDVILADLEHGPDLIIGVGADLLVVGRPHLEPGHRVLGEVLLGFGPVEQGFYRLGVMIDGGRGGRLVGAAPRLGPAALLGGHIVDEVPDMVPGDARSFRPAMLAGKPVQFRKDVLVVGPTLWGEVLPGQESGDDAAQGCGFGFEYHFSFLPVLRKYARSVLF